MREVLAPLWGHWERGKLTDDGPSFQQVCGYEMPAIEISEKGGQAVYVFMDAADVPVEGVIASASSGEDGAITLSIPSVKPVGQDQERGAQTLVFRPTLHAGVWQVYPSPSSKRGQAYLDTDERARYPLDAENCDDW